jgi:hypothetical protein
MKGAIKMKKREQMRLRFVRLGILDSVLADIYDTFYLYGEMFCVTKSIDKKFELCEYFNSSHFKTGVCIGRDRFNSILLAKKRARQRLSLEGKTKILEYIKKWPVINY